MDFLYHYLVAAGLFVLFDAIWLSTMTKRFYRVYMGKMVAEKPNFVAAVIFYAIYIVAIIFFVVNPALDKDSLNYAIGAGAFLGLSMYATYDLTNHATLKNWPAKVTYVDLAWGTFVTGIVSTLTFIIFR